MVYSSERRIEACLICGRNSNTYYEELGHVVHCERCGDFRVDPLLAARWQNSKDDKKIALASHLIRKMQQARGWPSLTAEFFASLSARQLPTPAEAMDSFVVWLGNSADGRFGSLTTVNFGDPKLISTIGVVAEDDLKWVVYNVRDEKWLQGSFGSNNCAVSLTLHGWARYSSLRSAHVASRYAFFARQFDNSELDQVFAECLYPAVRSAGYELRTVTQKAGPVDAIIEDEIRRCSFLIADLSDNNLGAYWEAGFAEGLGKPVIYICREKDKDTGKFKNTHFDTDHRHTVRWDLISLDETAKKLKAVIRNTLLGDANQSDE